jgi:alpha-beta hydrolase superfamily lysophospholipase
MELAPRLIDVSVPPDPAGAVLVLHGGGSRRESVRVSPTQLSVLRMIPIARRLARVGRGRLAVFRLLNSQRGWATHHTPVQDAHWALDEIAERLGTTVPTCLVGHSLGGRAALLAAPRPEVVSAVALAPWVYASDVPRGLGSQRLLFVHGTADRVASYERSAALARRLAALTEVSFVTVEGGKHAMLAHRGDFERPAADFAVRSLLADVGTVAA